MDQLSPLSRWLTILFPLLCGVVIATLAQETNTPEWFLAAAASVVVSLALWRSWPGARWYGVIFFAACAVERLSRLYVEGGTQHAIAVILFGWLGVRVFHQWRPVARQEEQSVTGHAPTPSRVPKHLVGLLDYVPRDEEAAIQVLLERALPECEFNVHRHRQGFYTIQFTDGGWALRVAARGEFGRSNTGPREAADDAVLIALRDHVAVVGIVPLVRREKGDVVSKVAEARIGRVLAEFLASGGLAIGSNEHDRWVALQPEHLFQLRSGSPWSVLESDSKALPSGASWDAFERSFSERKRKKALGPYWVLAPFAEGAIAEALWVRVDAIEGESVLGTVDQRPRVLKEQTYGEPAEVARESLLDWAFVAGNELHRNG